MYTLLLDSSNRNLSVAIAQDNVILSTVDYDAWQKQSELLVNEISNLLKILKIKANEISKIGVAIGPGSYTGVRIAVTIAKVYGYALKIPVYGLSSLSVLSHGQLPSICVINARSDRSFIGVYHGNKTVIEDIILNNEQVLNYGQSNPNFVFCGDVNHLGIKSAPYDRFKNMLSLLVNENLIIDLKNFKPRYVKN